MNRRLIVFVGFMSLILGACASDDGEVAAPSEARNVRPGDVATLEDGTEVRMTGTLFVTPDSIRLCESILESYPPQCGEPAVELTGVTAEDVIGLSTPIEPDLADVAWSDVPVSVYGTVREGTVAVSRVDQMSFSNSSEGVLVRLSFHPDPLSAGGPVTWVMDVTNERDEPLELTFSTGQSADVALASDGAPVYRWSDEMLFTQALRTVTLAPGERFGAVLPAELTVEPGDYDIEGWFVANEIRDLIVAGSITVE
jgi:hypothetical protein